MTWEEKILDFWFKQLEPKDWFTKNEKVDEEIRAKFEETWLKHQEVSNDHFLSSPEQALASIILFDQLPRNMFRGQAKAFLTDAKALSLTEEAIKMSMDKELTSSQRSFMYMPLQHSEDPSIQELSVMVFTELGNGSNLAYAKEHQEIISRFGRFPHRNEILGRESTKEELEFLKEHSGF